MIGLTRLVTGRRSPSDEMRYGGAQVTPHQYVRDGAFRPVVVWNITQSCNLACRHCYYSAILGHNPITIPYDEVTSIIDSIASTGAPVLLFSGGEPLIRKDIFDLVAYTAEAGIKPVISTNGTIIKPAVARRLVESGARYVGISIDGARETHDDFRQKRGAYEKSLRAIEACKAEGIRISVRFTVTEYNRHELDDVIAMAEAMGVDRFCLYHLVPSGRAKRDGDVTNAERRAVVEDLCERSDDLAVEVLTVDAPHDGPLIYLWTLRNRPERAADVLAALSRQGGDGTGMRIVEIDHDGNVHPNQFWLSHTFGNARTTPFADVWNQVGDAGGDELLAGLRAPERPLEGRCAACVFRPVCGGFRARAMHATGNPWAEDPSCPLTDEEISSTPVDFSTPANAPIEVPAT